VCFVQVPADCVPLFWSPGAALDMAMVTGEGIPVGLDTFVSRGAGGG
jgi:hypothetical protein